MRKEEIKLSLFADDMIVYQENPPKTSSKKKKILELRSKFSKVVGYKIKIYNSFEFPYNRNEQLEKQRD